MVLIRDLRVEPIATWKCRTCRLSTYTKRKERIRIASASTLDTDRETNFSSLRSKFREYKGRLAQEVQAKDQRLRTSGETKL